MLGFVRKLLRIGALRQAALSLRKRRDPVRYEIERGIASSGTLDARKELAGSPETHQEILYYLAENDPSARVRAIVAQNIATPIHAAPLLARDKDSDVRLALARRMIDLLPELSVDRQSQLYAYVVQALGNLALDEVLKIRKALSSALKDHAQAPPKVASQLAQDLEREVAEPVLKFCAAIADEDLMDILAEHPASWAVEAIAGRAKVSKSVSKAVIATNNRPAGVILLKNDGAVITESLLEDIISRARDYPEWQEPIATRKTLPPAMAKMLAEFAEGAVRSLLLRRSDLDEETLAEVSDTFKRRLKYAKTLEKSKETAEERAIRLHKKGKLTEETINDALAMRDHKFVMAAIATLCDCAIEDITHVFSMKAPKPVVAITWKAGLSMRIALRFQQELAHVPPRDLLYPKGGDKFSLTTDEMTWQLEFLGLKAA